MANIIHQFYIQTSLKHYKLRYWINQWSIFLWMKSNLKRIYIWDFLSVFAKGMWTNITEINGGGVGSFIKLNLRLQLSLYGVY